MSARSPQYAWCLFDACCLVEITCCRDPLVVGCAWALTFGRGRRPPNAFWCFFPSWCSPCVFTFLLNGSLLFSENLCVLLNNSPWCVLLWSPPNLQWMRVVFGTQIFNGCVLFFEPNLQWMHADQSPQCVNLCFPFFLFSCNGVSRIQNKAQSCVLIMLLKTQAGCSSSIFKTVHCFLWNVIEVFENFTTWLPLSETFMISLCVQENPPKILLHPSIS